MTETAKSLSDAQTIAEHIARLLLSKAEYPEFGEGGVPMNVAAKVFGKDATWVQAGIIAGWLPIGTATKKGKLVTSLDQIKSGERTNYYISPKLLWEQTGYVWKGEEGR